MRKSHAKKTSLPLVRLNLVQSFLIELKRRGIDVDPILGEFDLTAATVESANVFVPAPILYRMLERFAIAAGDPHLGVQQGEALNISTWSPFIEAASTARTVSGLFLRCSVNASRDASSVRLSLTTAGDRSDFQVYRFSEPSVRPAQVDAFWIGILVSILKKACGPNWEPDAVVASVCDTRALPVAYAGIRLAEHGSVGPKVSFPSDWLLLPFLADALDAGDDTPQRSPVAQSFVESLRQTLMPHIADPTIDANAAADLCDMKKRTLQLRLQERGTSFRHVIDELRRRIAADDLQDTERSVSDIATRVGYTNPAAFSRAFKKWTGLSPRDYRRKLAGRKVESAFDNDGDG